MAERRRRPLSDETVAAMQRDLAELSQELGQFPTLAQLDTLGRSDLRNRVSRYGGVRCWARRVGWPIDDRRRDPVTDEEARQLARAYLDNNGGPLPGEHGLRRAKHSRLAGAVRRAGGIEAFKQKHGL